MRRVKFLIVVILICFKEDKRLILDSFFDITIIHI